MAARRHEIAHRLYDEVLRSEPRSVRPGMSRWHQAVGMMVHRAAGDFAERRGLAAPVLAQQVTEWVNLHAKDTTVFGNLSKARSQITGATCVYLTRHAPGAHAQYLGAEISYDVDGVRGRVDLAWFVPGLGVVIDEIKTQSWTNLAVDARMLEQVHRYRVFGVGEWGEGFAGVRFLPLRYPTEMRFVTPDGDVHNLAQSPAASAVRNAA